MATPQDIPALMAVAHQILQEAEADTRKTRPALPPIARESRPAASSRLMFDIGDLDTLSEAFAR